MGGKEIQAFMSYLINELQFAICRVNAVAPFRQVAAAVQKTDINIRREHMQYRLPEIFTMFCRLHFMHLQSASSVPVWLARLLV